MEITDEVQKDMDALAGMAPAEEETPPEQEEVEVTPPVKEEAATPEEEGLPVKEESSSREEAPADALAQENERLRQELNELARKTGGAPPERSAEVLPPKTESTAEVEFLSAEEAEAILDDPRALNKILNKVFQAGREITMREMPTLVRQQALMEMNIQRKVQHFWTENKDLEPYKDFCSMVASQLEVENPAMAFDEVLTKTGEVARQRLNLPAKGEKKGDAPTEEETLSLKPALPGSPRAARRPPPAPKPTEGQQSEMEDLAKAFGI